GLLGLRGGELGSVDGGAAADREDPVGLLRHLDAVGGDLGPAADVQGHVEVVPARAGDHEWALDPGLGERVRQLVEAPADDHVSRSRATSTNARAARVSDRPAARTRWISRSRSSPATRASTSVPAARSSSIDAREMNVTP